MAKAKFVGYVRYSLDTAVKAMVREKNYTDGAIWKKIQGHIDEGYKFGLVYEEENNAYFASLYAGDRNHPNAGLLLGARHSDLGTACSLLLVLHEDVFQTEWPTPDDHGDQYTW